jgi:hypothetical protein
MRRDTERSRMQFTGGAQKARNKRSVCFFPDSSTMVASEHKLLVAHYTHAEEI